MTILDINGNTVSTGLKAVEWFLRNRGNIAESTIDSASRRVVTYKNGKCAMFFAQDEMAAVERIASIGRIKVIPIGVGDTFEFSENNTGQ